MSGEVSPASCPKSVKKLEKTHRWRPETFSESEPNDDEIVLNSTCLMASGPSDWWSR
jgi:hypothetical protein